MVLSALVPMTATTTLLEPSFFDLIAAIEQAPRPVGTDPAALGLLAAANRQMAGSPSRGHPRPLAVGTDLRAPIASRPRRRHG